MSHHPLPRRLADEELFRITPRGLEEISDATLNERVDALFRQQLAQANESLSQLVPIEAV